MNVQNAPYKLIQSYMLLDYFLSCHAVAVADVRVSIVSEYLFIRYSVQLMYFYSFALARYEHFNVHVSTRPYFIIEILSIILPRWAWKDAKNAQVFQRHFRKCGESQFDLREASCSRTCITESHRVKSSLRIGRKYKTTWLLLG